MSNYDERHPYYKGKWKKSVPYKDKDFAIDDMYDEPHAKRKKAILKKYPQIANLYGPSNKTKYIIFLTAALHCLGLYISTKINSKWLFFIHCLFWGGTLTGLAGILIHECCHNLAAKSSKANIFLGYMSNIPVLIPIYISFQKYHLDHHLYLGVRNKDPDLPLPIEIRMVEGNTLCKIIYISFYPVFYIWRAMFIPKRVLKEEILNIILHCAFIYLEYRCFGICGIKYHTLSSWLGYSLHPVAAHLIQEHFTFEDGQETYSYYGPFNKLFLNIGYHNEHHDFMSISWDKLPQVNKIANEYYKNFMVQTSWFGVMYEFITRPVHGPQSRVTRELDTHMKAKKIPIKDDTD